MARGLLAKKIGMTSLFEEDGRCLPVTILEAKKNQVIQIKNKTKDGYEAAQIGFLPVRKKLLNKSEVSRQKGLEKPYSLLCEFRDFGECEEGQELSVDIFEIGSHVTVTGTSKGKGFQGVMKRYNFSGGRATHGSHFHRSTGSLNASAYPSRVFKGKKMPGRMGNDRKAIRNLAIVAIDKEEGLLFIKGSVPGSRESCVKIEIIPKKGTK